MSEVQIAIIDEQDTQIALAVPGIQGPAGAISSGGSANQVFYKVSGTNYDAGWTFIGNANVDAAAAIAGTKISPDFGAQTIVTTGVHSAALGAAATPSITFTGDTNTGIYSPGADQLAVATNGTGRLFIDANGNVKITSSQYQAIAHKYISADTNYGAVVIGSGSGYQGNIALGFDVSTTTGYNFNGTGQTYFNPNGALIPNNAGTDYIGLFSRNSSDSILLGPATSSGKASGPLTLTSTSVGIGTTSPNRRLEVSDAGVDNLIRVNTNGATKTGIEFANGGTVYSQLYFNNVAPYDLSLLQQYTTGSLILGTNSTERARIDSSGRLLVGTSTSPSAGQGQHAKIVIQGYAPSTPTGGGYFSLQRGQAASGFGANEQLGLINFGDNTGASFALIEGYSDGTPGANDFPGRLVFSTTADGSASPTEAMRINNQQELLVGTATRTANGGKLQISNGITFPATAVACTDVNTLDDYEEGTFTPALGDSANGVATMSTQEGKYVKVGKIVQFSLQIVWTAKNTWTGTNTRINGLPFAATANTGAYYWPNPAIMNCNLTTTAFNYAIEATTAWGYIMDLLSNQIDVSNFPSSGRVLVNGVYQTA